MTPESRFERRRMLAAAFPLRDPAALVEGRHRPHGGIGPPMTGSDPRATAELQGIAPFVALNAEQLERFLPTQRLLQIPAG